MEPASSDLAELLGSSVSSTTFSDDIAALHELQVHQKHQKTTAGIVVQHRSWSTQDVFHSDAQTLLTSPTMVNAPLIASSPPPTPSPPQKRTFAQVNLGENQLARPAKAQRTYYGIDIHQLLDDAQTDAKIPKAVHELPTPPSEPVSTRSSLLWTEKYRARKFTDLIGDERTHRAVMHWLKRWDPIVFPGMQRQKAKALKSKDTGDERPHRKILVLTGPPGLGKTTLAHVCAKQAGFEVQEINASDERSSGVVKGRIRDMLGTENVKGAHTKTAEGKTRKAGKPVCVIVDEVDGVVTGSGGGGEGGFIKALLDLVVLDQKNSTPLGNLPQAPSRNRKGDRFRLLRPLILICNDIYHPSLRPLRQGPHAEVIHVGKASVQSLISRLHAIFDKEGVPCESDGVRRLCEATWGVSNRKEDRSRSGASEGDMRGLIVVGEWVASKVRSMNSVAGNISLTRRWVEDNILTDLAHGGGAARGLGRGGPKDIVARVFQEGAGFPKAPPPNTTPQNQTGNAIGKGVAEGVKRTAGDRLRELIATHGDTDRIMTDCFSQYAIHPFQDDTLLSKPDAAYEWLHFHDCLSSAVYRNNEWELAPYLSTPILGFHHLFASPMRAQYASAANDGAETDSEPTHPFFGTQASWAAHEAEKQNTALLQSFQSSLSLDLSRSFNSASDVATDLLPFLVRMLSPNVQPVVIGGSGSERSTASVRKASEQALVQRAVQAMGASGVRFERTKVTPGDDAAGAAAYGSQWIYRMEPPVDGLGLFETGGKAFGEARAKTRFAVRQVLDQEWTKEEKRRAEVARLARFGANTTTKDVQAKAKAADSLQERGAIGDTLAVKRDFFGRPIAQTRPSSSNGDGNSGEERTNVEERRVWVTYHEGFSNAVRKPITLAELMKDL